MADFPPDDGHWWEYRIGFGWVQRAPDEVPPEVVQRADESAA